MQINQKGKIVSDLIASVGLIFTGIVSFFYCRSVRIGTTEAKFSTWLMFTSAVLAGFISYLAAGHTLLSNPFNTLDAITVPAILLSVWTKEKQLPKFSGFEKWCLLAVIATLNLWAWTKDPAVANSLLQLIMLVAYFPLYRGLFFADKSPEPLWVWIMFGFSMIFALGNAITHGDILATIYAIRAMLCVVIVLYLIVRISWRARAFQ